MSASANPIATGWLNENALREYPFHEGVGLRPNDSAGVLVENGWTLPNCLVVDMAVSVLGSDVDPFLYLGSMSVVGGSVTLAFCNRDGERVMSVYATASGHAKNSSYQMSGVGSWSGARGVICLGDLDEFFGLTPDGMYSFSPEETELEPTCIRPSPVGVRALEAVDSTGYATFRLTGDVKLVAGDNIMFDYRSADNALVVSANPNSGYREKCDCGDTYSTVVRSINGIAVNDVWIDGGGCLNIESDEGTGVIRMSDECAKPCCGCAETAFINQTINDLQTSVTNLSGNLASLGDRLTSFITSYVLGRKTVQ